MNNIYKNGRQMENAAFPVQKEKNMLQYSYDL